MGAIFRAKRVPSKPEARRSPPHVTKNRGVPICLIGAGNHGRMMGDAVIEMGYDVVAVCDLSPESLEKFTEVHPGVRTTSNLSDLRDLGAEVAIVATLADAHLPVIQELASLGISRFLCEKPVVDTLEDMDALRHLVGAHGLHIEVNHPGIWHPDYAVVRDRLQGGGLGKLESAEVHFKPGGFGNIGSHCIAQVLYLLGTTFHRVESAFFEEEIALSRAPGHEDRNGRVIYLLGGGVPLTFNNLRSEPQRVPRSCFEFEDGRIELRSSNSTWLIFDREEQASSEYSFGLRGVGLIKAPAAQQRLLDRTLSSLLTGQVAGSFEYACQAVEAIIAAHHSFVRGEAVPLPPTRSDPSPFRFS